jgi:para-aminobenzoate synthetase/4-amino-4-deoxychorismate lyase
VKIERGYNGKKRYASKTLEADDQARQEAWRAKASVGRAQEASDRSGSSRSGAQADDLKGHPHSPEAAQAGREDIRFLSDTGAAAIQTPEGWRLFRDPVDIIETDDTSRVVPCLHAIEAAVDEGMHAAGFVSYEAGPAFDEAMLAHPCGKSPLVWFGIYADSQLVERLPDVSDDYSVGDWIPSLSFDEYALALKKIKAYIAAGDTYQVNFTLRLRSQFSGSTEALFADLCGAQRASHSAYINTDTMTVCSASPELFFSLNGTELVSRPMKGTAPRGRTSRDDIEQRTALQLSDKNRAENVMIVDMIRNDMGRIAKRGSVVPDELFAIEQYPTVFQMTSTVSCQTTASFVDIMRAMFPCASITGAPKVRTTGIIKELEGDDRGVYTGTMGYLLPGRKASFNVAIRTVTLDKQSGAAEYGVGGGIVWDSVDKDEYAECATKAALLTEQYPAFELLETVLWEPGDGYFLLDLHLRRLAESAEYFGYAVDMPVVMSTLKERSAAFGTSGQRVRLLCGADGQIAVEATPFLSAATELPYRLRMSGAHVDSTNIFLYHKTTNRSVY